LIPLGGSLVILTLSYNKNLGKLRVEEVVSHNLKSGWLFLSIYYAIYSANSSNSGNHVLAKWQFYNNTQLPIWLLSIIFLVAVIP